LGDIERAFGCPGAESRTLAGDHGWQVNLRQLISDVATANRTWGEERIAAELLLKLGLRIVAADRSLLYATRCWTSSSTGLSLAPTRVHWGIPISGASDTSRSGIQFGRYEIALAVNSHSRQRITASPKPSLSDASHGS
jgi:hypothetical protein